MVIASQHQPKFLSRRWRRLRRRVVAEEVAVGDGFQAEVLEVVVALVADREVDRLAIGLNELHHVAADQAVLEGGRSELGAAGTATRPPSQ